MPNAKTVKPLFRAPNRCPNGVGTAPREDIKGLLGLPDPSDWHIFFEDFDYIPATSKFTNVIVGTGTGVTTTGADGGILTIVNSAGGTDAFSTGQTTPNFLPQVTRSLIFETQFEVDSATLANAGAGMIASSNTLTPFTYTEGIAIRKPSGASTFVIEVKKAGTTQATSAFGGAVCPANTQIKVGFAYRGFRDATTQKFLFKLDLNDGNGPRYQSLTVPTANVPTALLGASVGLLNGSAVARTMKVDYILAGKDRFFV